MAISFPLEQPIKFYKWTEKVAASNVLVQGVDLLDESMYQFVDDELSVESNYHRVVILNNLFEPIAELSTSLAVRQNIGTNRVYTLEVGWTYYGVVGDKLFIAVVDANKNTYLQNFMPNGALDSSVNWRPTANVTIGSGYAEFVDTNDVGSLDYELPIRVGAEYTVTVNASNFSGTNTTRLFNGATGIGTIVSGDNSFTFTATEAYMSIEFQATGAASCRINTVTCEMAFEDVIPNFISTPFCIANIIDSTMLIHGCANNDYFNCYYESTNFIPRLRVNAEIWDRSPLMDVERAFLSNGNVINHYAQRVTMQELRVDWMPSYLVNFMTTVFLLDQSYIDNINYTIAEDVQIQEDSKSPEVKAYVVAIVKRSGGVSYKRIVNDPSANECIVPIGGYIQQGTDEEYLQQGTDAQYYPQQ